MTISDKSNKSSLNRMGITSRKVPQMRPSGCCTLIKEAFVLHSSKSASAGRGGIRRWGSDLETTSGKTKRLRVLVGHRLEFSFDSPKNQRRVRRGREQKEGGG